MKRKLLFLLPILGLFFLWFQIPFSSALFSLPPSSSRSNSSSSFSSPPTSHGGSSMPGMIPDSLTLPEFSGSSCKTKEILKNSKTSIRFLKNISREQFIAGGTIAETMAKNMPSPPPFATGISWIGQFDTKKKSLWQYCFAKRSSSPMPDDVIQDMIVTPDGGYLGVGTSSFGRSGPIGNAWAFKLDAKGKLQWQKMYGRLFDPRFGAASFMSVISTPDSGYVVSGGVDQRSDLTSSGGCKVAVCSASTSRAYGLLMKLNANGEIQWQKTYGMDDGGLSFQRMLPLENGGFVVTGTTLAFDAADAWLGGFDSEGNVLWQKVFGKAKANEIRTIRKDHDGNLIIAGMLRLGFARPWALKLDPNGNVLWQKSFGKNVTLEMFDMEESIDQKGYVFLVRTIPTRAELDKDFLVPQTMWIFQLDSDGNFMWQKGYRTVMHTFSILLRRFGERYLMSSELDLIPVDAMGKIKKSPPKILDSVKVNFPSEAFTQDEVNTDIQDYEMLLSEEE